MLSSKPFYSIITPVFNRADCIGRCIESVIKNLADNIKIEHIIVDDGSNDNTAEIVNGYADKYSHIKFLRFDRNKGTNAARNAAISIALGDWCIILDSDDYFVADALKFVLKVMCDKPGYRHYMFAPDDMQTIYKNNQELNTYQKVLSFFDFLSCRVGGDFIHVCDTEILKAHPFNEHVRIHEGVFFLMFFRDAQKMLFTNRVITIRERNRTDSVTRETIRTDKKIIERIIVANELMLDTFKNDYINLKLDYRLCQILFVLYENYLLVGKYAEAKRLERKINGISSLKYSLLLLIRHLHIGWLYRIMLQSYLKLKYNIMNTKLKQ